MTDRMHIARIAASLLMFAALPAIAQNDLSVAGILAPRSGCALTASENVTVRIFNYGSTLPAGTSFNVAYSINAGTPLTEFVVLPSSLTSNTAFTYTFTTQADLSAPGVYSFDAAVSLAGDISPANDTLADYVVIDSAPSVGGDISGDGGPTLTGVLTLSAQVGSVLEWQQSEDGLRWRALSNNATTQVFDQLREHTQFRALVANGACAPALSSAHLVLSSDPIFYSGFEP